MWVEEIDIRGFKHLRGRWRLGQGLTVVTGPNESGKSTLQEILIRILFGFSSSERRRYGGESAKDRCRPWDGNPFAVNARLRDVRGRSLAVEWDFEAHAVTLREADTGEDHSAEVRGRREDVTLGSFLLDLGLDEFREVCCLHQAAISAVAHTEPLVLALRKSVETGTPDVGVREADERLTDYLREVLGVHSGHYGDLRNGPLATVREERFELAEMLNGCEEEREAIAHLAVELARKKAERKQLGALLERDRQALLLTELRRLQTKLQAARDHAQTASERPEQAIRLPESIADEVTRREADVKRLTEQIQYLERQVHERASELEPLRARHTELAREADALSLYAEIDGSREDDVRALVARLESIGAPSGEPAPAPERDLRLARFRRERSRLLELSARGGGVRWDAIRLSMAGILAVISLAAGAIVHAVAFSGLLVAGALVATARRPDDRLRWQLDSALQALGASSLAELEAQAAEEERRIIEAETLAREGESAAEERRQVLAELQAAVDAAGAAMRDDIHERAAGYLAACEKHRKRAEIQGEIGQLEARMARAEQPRRDLEQRRHELNEASTALAAAYAQVGIDSDDVERAAREFAALMRRATADAEAVRRAQSAGKTLHALLEGGTLADLERRVDDAVQRHREHVARFGELVSGPGHADELADTVKRLDGQVRALEPQIAELEARIHDREERLPNPAELRERITELTGRISRMERARDAIRIARAELGEAAREAHREFAPHLNEALARNLPRITGGRYSDAAMDEGLQIQVTAPETGRLVDAEQLSRGTQDQIYLVERLEIARLLDPTTGEAPLLLDDPFDHFDDSRLRYGLELLGEVAQERQVLLFAEETELVPLAREVCGECDVLELPGPTAATSVEAA